jgi:hypothetical protein
MRLEILVLMVIELVNTVVITNYRMKCCRGHWGVCWEIKRIDLDISMG